MNATDINNASAALRAEINRIEHAPLTQRRLLNALDRIDDLLGTPSSTPETEALPAPEIPIDEAAVPETEPLPADQPDADETQSMDITAALA